MSARQAFSETDSPNWYRHPQPSPYSGSGGQRAPHSTPLALYNNRNTNAVKGSGPLSMEESSRNVKAQAKVYANSNSNASSRRKPIQNPFEKFPKGEFDAWIEDLKGALKRARGEEAEVELDWEEENKTKSSVQKHAFAYPEETPVHPTHTFRPFLPPGGGEEEEEEEEGVNDSFADLVARRKGKGKARDPREGPGLMAARRTLLAEEPTFILSSDEEEEEEVSRLTIRGLDSESEEEEEEEEDDHERDMLDDEAEDLVRGHAAQRRRAAWAGEHAHVDLVDDDEEDELRMFLSSS